MNVRFEKEGVVPDDKLESAARALAVELAESATYALALAKVSGKVGSAAES